MGGPAPTKIGWTAMLRVSDEGAASKLLCRLHEQLGLPMKAEETERYWKDETLYRCTFVTPLPESAAEFGSDCVLDLAQRLAPGWHVSGRFIDGSLEGVADRGIRVPGVSWLHFSIDA